MAKVATITAPKASAKPQVLTILIANIENKFDVRQTLDDDRVLYLAELYQGGVDVAPISVIKVGPNAKTPGEQKYAYVDGRHRGAARVLADFTTIEATLVDASEHDMAGLYAESLRANWGGAKPPTRQDISHTIIRMFESGASHARIHAALAFLPKSVFDRYSTNAMSNLNKKKILAALDAVGRDGLSVPEAAAKFKVDPEKLRDAISGNRKKLKNSGTVLQENKAFLTTTMRSANSKIAGKFKALLDRVEDSEIPVSVAVDVLAAWKSSAAATQHRIKDWEERVQSLADNLGKG